MNRGGWCDICGAELGVISLTTVRLAVPDPKRGEFVTAYRCEAREQCRARVEQQGKVWPVIDGTTPERGMRVVFTEAHRRVFEAARKWRDDRRQEGAG